ncbi:MAG: rod shape-determining protein RodA [Leptospirales bacterium]|nr:rod shape-determining protein RodA [Leptospirales bacterium]
MKGYENLYKIDYLLIAAVTLIALIGCLLIYSGGFDPIEKTNNGLYKKQIIWFVIGFIFMMVFAFINYHQLGDYSHYIYIALILLLCATFLGGSIRNIKAWLYFGTFSIQPAEFMKLGVVIFLARILEARERDIKHFREIVLASIIFIIPIIIIFKQPDFGTAVLFIPILFTMLFVGGADITHLVSIILTSAIALVVPMAVTYSEWVGDESSNILFDFFKNTKILVIVSLIFLLIAAVTFGLRYIYNIKKIFRRIYVSFGVLSFGLLGSIVIQNFFKPYQKKRILVFLNPELDPQASGYHIIQSKIAIGSGGFTGKGFLQGSQSQLGFLPEKTSDFIFSVAAEEWGFLGAVIVLLLLGFVLFRGVQTALEAKDKFGALLASGITATMFMHIMINVGMNTGIMPVTGLPLCFVSYGGSNLLMSMISIGILLNIRSKRHVYAK